MDNEEELIHLRRIKEISMSFFESLGIYPIEIFQLINYNEAERLRKTIIAPLDNPFQYNIFHRLENAVIKRKTEAKMIPLEGYGCHAEEQ